MARTVLVADDNPLIRKALCELFYRQIWDRQNCRVSILGKENQRNFRH